MNEKPNFKLNKVRINDLNNLKGEGLTARLLQ